MTELKLCAYSDVDNEPEVYPFPAAGDAERSEGARSTPLDFDGRIDSIDMARHIESALDDLQRRLDRVKEEMDAAYRFPGPEDWPPSAA
ncbi:MAG: hypothetical protein EA376_01010 [Phycisphaeraceae bacterium]|nr:MAG: hypothetical protein EA376_01010 [Phycisphaeraceae bacterium]